MACAISPDPALDTSPSSNMYRKAHTYVYVRSTSGFAHVEFHMEHDKVNIRSRILAEHPLTITMKVAIRNSINDTTLVIIVRF